MNGSGRIGGICSRFCLDRKKRTMNYEVKLTEEQKKRALAEPHAGNIEQIKEDIVRARKWARVYFNVGQKEDHVLAPPTFDIEYLGPDTIRVWPRSYGKRLEPYFTYTLIWAGESLIWRGENPFLSTRIDLVIGEATTDEAAFQRVEAFVREHGYKGEVRGCQIVRRDRHIDVFLLRPYGLFIIRPDGSVEDNYRIFAGEQD